jgi:hypothetical protein
MDFKLNTSGKPDVPFPHLRHPVKFMLKIINLFFTIILILLFNGVISMANDTIEFKYAFSDKFYNSTNLWQKVAIKILIR